jgi:hypothetical protein
MVKCYDISQSRVGNVDYQFALLVDVEVCSVSLRHGH